MKTSKVAAAIVSTAVCLTACAVSLADTQAAPPTGQPALSKSHSAHHANAANPHLPGATGTAIVKGDPSTLAGDAAATRIQQTNPTTIDGR